MIHRMTHSLNMLTLYLLSVLILACKLKRQLVPHQPLLSYLLASAADVVEACAALFARLAALMAL